MTEFSNEFSRQQWEQKYRFGEEETVDDSFKRVAKHLASVEKDPAYWEEQFYSVMENFRFIPGGRIMSNAGTGLTGTTMINCYVDALSGTDQDSIEGIYAALTRQAQILKSEGGYGFCCSVMRPRGSHIGGIGNQTPGSVKFLELWDKSSEIITAGGNSKPRKDQKKFIRKGAQMVTQHSFHPDIEEFITAKQERGRLSKFNMSVLCTDDFMKAVENDEPWDLVFPDYEKYKEDYKEIWDGNLGKWKEYIVKKYGENEGGIVVYKTFDSARELWNIIMESTYNRNEPGVLFVDTMNRMNNLRFCEDISAVNPCGEQILPKDGVCLLGSINLTQFVDIKNKSWDYDELKRVIPIIIRLMDNVNDKTLVPLESQKVSLLQKRRIGMGVFGYGSALVMMGFKYGSNRAIELTEELMSFISNFAYCSSAILAEEKGAFPLYDEKKYLDSNYIKSVLDKDTIKLIKKHGIRNSHLMSIQPTGNSSVFANLVSGGLEPLFSFGYYRTWIVPENEAPEGLHIPKKIDWDTKSFESKSDWVWVKEGDENILSITIDNVVYKYDSNRGLTQERWVEDYAITNRKEQDRWNPDAPYACNIFTLEPKDHIKTMAVFAKYVDSAISKTINLPNDYPYEDFKNIYIDSWKQGIKGFTTYREGTMTNVLSRSSSANKIQNTLAPKRPKELPCDVFNISVQKSPYFVLVGKLDGVPYEVFAGRSINEVQKCKGGKIVKSFKPKGYRAILEDDVELFPIHAMSSDNEEALTRMISTSLRHGADLHFVVEQLEKVKGDMTTLAKAIARALKKYIPDGTTVKGECPECNNKKLIRMDGCKTCTECNYTACE